MRLGYVCHAESGAYTIYELMNGVGAPTLFVAGFQIRCKTGDVFRGCIHFQQ